jgi:hypothetical protein
MRTRTHVLSLLLVQVEEYVDSDDKDSDVVNNGTKEFSNRHSFMVMKERMQKNVSIV